MVKLWRSATVAAMAILAFCIMTKAGERSSGDIQLDSESLNACGVSFAAAGDVELGWTIGQHGLHVDEADECDGSVALQSGFWTGSSTRYEGTLFMFR
jgi:hypothetical protein